MSKVEERDGLVPELRFGKYPEDWSESTLGKCCNFINGRAYKKSELLNKGKYRVLRVGNLFTNNSWYYSDLELDEDKYCDKGDILYAWSASFGPRIWLEEKVIYHYHIWKVVKKKRIKKKFLFYLLEAETSNIQAAITNGLGFKHITKGGIEKWKCFVPISKKEQQKIAKTLSSLDALITAHIDKLTALREHKKGLLQQLFPGAGEVVPGLRFGGFVGEWEEARLGDKRISSFVNKKTKHLDINSYVSTVNLLQDFKGVKKAEGLPQSGSFTEYEYGDILMSNIRPNLKKVWVALNSGASSNDVLVFRAGKRCIAAYLSHNIKSDRFINYVMKGAKGVKMPRGDKSQIMEYPLTISSKKEQQKIADCLTTLDDLITAQSKKIKTLRAHKKGLMQRLFPNPNG